MDVWTAQGFSSRATHARPQIGCYLFAVRLENCVGAILSPWALDWRECWRILKSASQSAQYWTAPDRIRNAAIRAAKKPDRGRNGIQAIIMPMTMSRLDESCFLNVDLERFSKSDLQPLVTALGSNVHIHYVGTEFGLFKAYLDLTKQPKTPESGILRLCKLIQRLTPSKRAIWDAGKSRSFDIGIEAPNRGNHYWSAVGSEAIRAAAEVNAQIAITVFAPTRRARQPMKKVKANSSE